MRGPIAAVVGALAAFAGASALAGVDAETAPNLKVKSGLAPGEAEQFRFRAEKGGTLTLSAKASPRSDLDFDLVLYDGDDTPVAIPPESVKDLGKKVSWRKFLFPASDDYRLEVKGSGSGDYALKLKVAPARKFADTLEFTFPILDFPFAAPEGSIVKAVAKTTRGSIARLEFQAIDGPNGFSQPLTDEGTKNDRGHSLVLAPLPEGGDYVFRIANLGLSGTFTVKVSVRAPKTRPVKLDLRGVSLGRPGGGETFVARTVGAQGGTVEVQDPQSDLDRARVDVPAGSVLSSTPISVGSTVVPPLGSIDNQAAGPAVDLRPSGTQFLVPVTVTLPFDFTQVPADATPDDIRVRIVEDDGSATVVVPDSVDAPGGTVSIQTSGFSVCIPIVAAGPPTLGFDSRGQVKPGGDEFWFLQCTAEFFPDGMAQDSRSRSLGVAFGTASFHSDGTLDFVSLDHRYSWQNGDAPPMSGLPIVDGSSESNSPDSGTINWGYDVSGRRILLSGAPETFPVFRISRDGRYIAARHEDLADPYAESLFGVRKNDAPLTTASLKGAWSGVYAEYSLNFTSSTGAAEPTLLRGVATVTFDGAGGAKVVVTERETEFNASNGSFAQPSGSATINGASYSIDGDGTVLLSIPPFPGEEDGSVIRLFPGQGLDLMLGGNDQVLGNGAFGLLLVRQGSGLSRSALVGAYHGAGFAADPNSYGVQSPTVRIADFDVAADGITAIFNGGNSVALSFDAHKVNRNPGEAGGLRVVNEVESFSLGVNLASNGKLALTSPGGGGVGAASPDGTLLALTSDVGSANGDYGLILLFPAPPDKTP